MKVPSLALMGPEEDRSVFFLRIDKALLLEMSEELYHFIAVQS